MLVFIKTRDFYTDVVMLEGGVLTDITYDEDYQCTALTVGNLNDIYLHTGSLQAHNDFVISLMGCNGNVSVHGMAASVEKEAYDERPTEIKDWIRDSTDSYFTVKEL